MSARHVYCRECGSQPGQRCTVNKTGKPTADHAARKKEARSTSAPEPVASYQPGMRAEDEREPMSIPSEIDVLVEDARRVARNRTFGIVDDTLDAVTILAELALQIDLVFDRCYTQEQHDAALDEKDDEIRTLTFDVERVTADAKLFAGRAEIAEGKVEQAEVDVRIARTALDIAVADAIAAKDRALALERELATYRFRDR